MFDCCDDDLGSRDLVQHKFILHYDVPIAEPYRRIPPYHLQETCFHTEDLVLRGIIEISASLCAAPIAVTRKKSGGLKLFCDYCKINAQTSAASLKSMSASMLWRDLMLSRNWKSVYNRWSLSLSLNGKSAVGDAFVLN